MSDYDCPCGWSRIVLEGETVDDARRAHEGTYVHRLAVAFDHSTCTPGGDWDHRHDDGTTWDSSGYAYPAGIAVTSRDRNTLRGVNT